MESDFAPGVQYQMAPEGYSEPRSFSSVRSIRRQSTRRSSRRSLLQPRGSTKQRSGSRMFGLVKEVMPGEVGKYEDQTADEISKKMKSDPDGNLYRGWAVGIQGGSWQFMMTCLVIFVQTFGPFAMVWWCWEKIHGGHFDLFWHSDPPPTMTDVFRKMLGMGFLILIFINGENILERSDLQTDKLRSLYGKVKRRWMFIDSFVNSWCVVFCAAAAGPLLWSSEDGIKDVILDSFGLLFLHNIDEYSSDIEYGIETSDFDDMIDEKQIELRERLASDTLRQEQDDHLRKSWVSSCILYGDMWFSVGRVLNRMLACATLPAYATLVWSPVNETDGANGTHAGHEVNETGGMWGSWGRWQIIASAVMYGLLILGRARDLWISQPQPSGSPRWLGICEDEPVSLDCIGIFIWLIVGRQDPRCAPKPQQTKRELVRTA